MKIEYLNSKTLKNFFLFFNWFRISVYEELDFFYNMRVCEISFSILGSSAHFINFFYFTILIDKIKITTKEEEYLE